MENFCWEISVYRGLGKPLPGQKIGLVEHVLVTVITHFTKASSKVVILFFWRVQILTPTCTVKFLGRFIFGKLQIRANQSIENVFESTCKAIMKQLLGGKDIQESDSKPPEKSAQEEGTSWYATYTEKKIDTSCLLGKPVIFVLGMFFFLSYSLRN